MGAYSVMLPDSRILKRVAGFKSKSVVIIGCVYCANDSIAFDKDYPISRLVVGEDTGKIEELPVPIVEEANRLKKLLENKGSSARIETALAPCHLSYQWEEDISVLVKRCSRRIPSSPCAALGGHWG